MNQDFIDLLRAFIAADVRFLIVGAYALALHGRPRATGDLDVWIEPTAENATRVMRALGAFGAPLSQISEADFAGPGVVYQIGVPPGSARVSSAFQSRAQVHGGSVTSDGKSRRSYRPCWVIPTPPISRYSDPSIP